MFQYQYGYSTLWVLAFNGARTGIGFFAFLSSTSMGTVHYLVEAGYITVTGIKWCQYQFGICAFWPSTSIGMVRNWYWE
jgi:hypothetical protein